MKQTTLLGSLNAVAATVTVGGSVAALSLLADYPYIGSQALRYCVGAAALGLVVYQRRCPLPRLSWREVAQLLTLALTGLIGFNLCILQALEAAEPAVVGVVIGCVPVVLALIGPLMERRAPSARVLAAGIIVSAGAAIVQGTGASSTAGLLFAFGALAGEAAFSLLAVSLLPRLGPLVLSAYVCGIAGLALLFGAIATGGAAALPPPSTIEAAAIGYLGLAVTAGAFIAWYTSIGLLGVERAGLFAGLIPISTLLSAALVGTGSISLWGILGVALVGAGVVLGIRTAPIAAG